MPFASINIKLKKVYIYDIYYDHFKYKYRSWSEAAERILLIGLYIWSFKFT